MSWLDRALEWFAKQGEAPLAIASKRSLERVQNGLEPLDQDFLIMQGESINALQERQRSE